MLAEGWFFQKTIDQLFVCARAFVFDEAIDFFGCRRQTGQVEGNAPDQRVSF